MNKYTAMFACGLILIEMTRRLFSTAECWVDLRYEPLMIDRPSDEIWDICWRRHAMFPFGMIR